MEPQLPMPQFGPEHGVPPQPPRGGELLKGQHSAESGPAPLESGKETRESLRDGPQGDLAATAVFTPPPLPVIDPAQATAPQQNTTSVIHDAPLSAGDEDLIEKEWVEKAKRVVAETKDDPHAQEDAISRLQADYLQKRYGRTIKVPQSDG